MKHDQIRPHIRGLILAILGAAFFPLSTLADFPLRLQTDLGAVDLLMLDSVAPNTVSNFMNYVNSNRYDQTFFHRSEPGFVIQGGGYVMTGAPGSFFSTGVQHIAEDAPVANEFNLSNVRGTLAMAKLPTGPDTATSEWFVNLADNSANLDNQNGGFTVFAQVQGAGMDVFDAIAALPICPQVAPSLFCDSKTYAEAVPVADSTGTFNNTTLINISIGTDSDGDGDLDKFEDASANGGDANGDSFPDSSQQYVASYLDENGKSVVLESPSSTPITEFSAVGKTYALAYPPETGSPLEGLIAQGWLFDHGYIAFEVPGIGAGGQVNLTLTLPAGEQPNEYFVYGPEPGNTAPHWYEFLYDGTTGAEFNGNVITLHFVDGLRGDADLNNSNGTIVCAHGGPSHPPGDMDGVSDAVENAGPNGGDGNDDGILDSLQGYVASLPDVRGEYVTVESVTPSYLLNSLVFSSGLTPTPTIIPEWLNGLNFNHGFLRYNLTGVAPGGSAEVRLILPAGETPVTYVMYGPEPGDATDHFYEFRYDPASGTGAEINGNVVTLHFVDGGRGDSDLAQDGVITDPGAPALAAPIAAPSGGGGGCSLGASAASPWQAGAWWLMGICLVPAAIRRLHRSHH
jgi:cyclophilin family peptidyl-prolyl cis-trans isomerase